MDYSMSGTPTQISAKNDLIIKHLSLKQAQKKINISADDNQKGLMTFGKSSGNNVMEIL